MNPEAWWLDPSSLAQHATAVALCCARLLPVAILSPLLGGSALPAVVRLTLVLALSLSLHVAGGVGAELSLPTAIDALAALSREVALGIAMGLVAALPFEAAKMGGRYLDLFRGSSAEAVLPSSGNREAVSGDFLQQLLVALAVTGVGWPIAFGALWRSFGWVRLGTFETSEGVVLGIAHWVTGAMASGLAIAAPVAGAALLVDLACGLAARIVPQLSLQEAAAPLKLTLGGLLLVASLTVVSGRLEEGLVESAGQLFALVAKVSPGGSHE